MNVRAAFQSVEHFRMHVATMQPGDVVMYHRGNLATDRRSIKLIGHIAEVALELGTTAGVSIRPEYPGYPMPARGTGFGQLYQKRVPMMIKVGDQLVPSSTVMETEYYLRRKPK